MDILVGLLTIAITGGIALGLIIFLIRFLGSSRTPKTKTRQQVRSAPRPVHVSSSAPALATGENVALTGRTFRLSANGRVSVAGESYRQDALRTLVRSRERVPDAGDWDNALRRDAILVPEPSNRHDSNAVRVFMEGSAGFVHVGYLPAGIAGEYVDVCHDLFAEGRLPLAAGRVVRGRGGLAAYLHLAAADGCAFRNDEPPTERLLEPDRQCAVTRETDHQDVLNSMVHGLYWATLHPCTVSKGKYTGEPTVEVRLNGLRVGELTTAQGAKHTRWLDESDPPACEATVGPGSKITEVTVHLPRVEIERPATKSEPAASAPVGEVEVMVVGTTYYQGIKSLSPGGHDATVRPDKGNKYDKNALVVHVNGKKTGYLSAHQAERYRPTIARSMRVRAHLSNGPGGQKLVVYLPRLPRN